MVKMYALDPKLQSLEGAVNEEITQPKKANLNVITIKSPINLNVLIACHHSIHFQRVYTV